jgi:hypothetical protein
MNWNGQGIINESLFQANPNQRLFNFQNTLPNLFQQQQSNNQFSSQQNQNQNQSFLFQYMQSPQQQQQQQSSTGMINQNFFGD